MIARIDCPRHRLSGYELVTRCHENPPLATRGDALRVSEPVTKVLREDRDRGVEKRNDLRPLGVFSVELS